MLKHAIIILLVYAIALTGCNKSSTSSQAAESEAGIVTASVRARIDSTLQAMVDSGAIAGVSALIVENDKEVYFNAFGMADIENGVIRLSANADVVILLEDEED